MKALTAATCVAILAAIGYFFWGEYRVAASESARVKQAELSADIAECRSTLVAYKNGGAAGFGSPAEAENKSRACAKLLNAHYGFTGEDEIKVDNLGVYVGYLD